MNQKALYVINIALTCLLCVVMLSTCGGCKVEQLDQAQVTTNHVQDVLHTLPDDITKQPWYVIALLIADIASSILAAWRGWKAK